MFGRVVRFFFVEGCVGIEVMTSEEAKHVEIYTDFGSCCLHRFYIGELK